MAALNPNATPRLWVDYNDGHNDHSLQCRYAASAGVEMALNHVALFFAALSPSLYLITIIGARASASGSNISLPVSWDSDPTYGSGAMPAVFAPRQICFLGRDSHGRRVRWFVFGWKGTTPDAYRIPVGDDAGVDAAITALSNAAVDSAMLTISLDEPTLYPYVDVNFNNYYEAKTRG